MGEVIAEVKVINSVLKNKDKQVLFSPHVDDLFTAYGDVWGFIKDYHDKYGDIPSIETVNDRFPDEVEDVSVPAAPQHYLDSLKAEFIDNKVTSLLTLAANKMGEGTTGVEVKSKLQNALSTLDRFDSVSRDLDVMDMDGASSRYDEVRAKAIAMGGTPGVPMGLDFINACMPLGMQSGDVITLIGYPARGKSALGALFAAKAIQKGFKPLIFSMEMTAEAVQDRIFTIMGSGLFSNSDLMLGDVNKDDFRSFADKNDGKGWVIDGTGTGPMTPNFMRSKIDQYRPDFVMIDYLQLCHDNNHTEDMTARVRNLSLEIKNLANQCQIPFLVICSATPQGGTKVEDVPSVEQISWSRQPSYDSTVSIAIHRYDGTDVYHVAGIKNRYGDLPEGFLKWDMDRGIYEEVFELD